MTTGKTIALTRQTFVGKAMSLLFNMLSRLVIAFLPRRKHLLISWQQSPSAVSLEPPKIKSGKKKKSLSLFPLFPHLFAMKWWDRMPWFSFFECWVLSPLFSHKLHLLLVQDWFCFVLSYSRVGVDMWWSWSRQQSVHENIEGKKDPKMENFPTCGIFPLLL